MTAVTGKPWLKWALIFGLWTLIGMAFAGQLYLSRFKVGDPVTWTFAAGRALADWYVFALLSIPAIWLSRRVRLEGKFWRRHLVIHLAASIVFSVSWMLLRALIEHMPSLWGGEGSAFLAAFTHALVATFFFNLLIYWVIASVSHAVTYYLKFQEREFRATELERSLTEAKLHALQMQLNPHFLFNTLHSISSLVHIDPEAADRMIAQLSDLLRQTLDSGHNHEVPLSQELHILKTYLQIEQTRFGERLKVHFDVDPGTLGASVPNLILQPIVENAIRHGIEPHAKPGEITLETRRDNSHLTLLVRDNGTGLAKDHSREGIGLSNTRARLQQLYPGRHQFNLRNAPEGGLIVTMTIPLASISHSRDALVKNPG